MSDSEFPAGWISASLPDFTRIEMGQSPPSTTYNTNGNGLPFFQGKAEFGALYPEVRKHCSEPNRIAQPGATLLSVRAPVGPTNLARERCCIGRGLAAIHPLDQIPEKFVLWLLRSREPEISEQGTGSTFAAINRKFLHDLTIPLPPLAEQKRIVAKIEELFSELDAGEESLRRARRQLGVYRQSLLKQAFEGKLTAPWRAQHPDLLESPSDLVGLIENCSERAKFRAEGSHPVDGWSFRCLDEVTEFVTSGSRGWADYYSDSGSLFIRAQNLNRDYLNLDEIAYVRPPESAEGRRTMVRYGDLLITITGANTTKSGWVHLPLDDAYVSQHVALCRPVSDLLSPFLYRYIISEAGGRKKLTADAYGAGKPGLNLDHVRSLVVPFPSLPEQQEIVRLLDAQFEVIEQNEREIDAALKRSEALRQSILKKAFTGQLVPQDPTDEPASALLERIRQERELAAKPKKANSRQ